MNYSKQREMTLKIVQQNMIHPTADFIYEQLKKELPSISLATVYRNLSQLAEAGLIRRVECLDGSVHYDYNTHNHYHFICNKCNKVYDIPYEVAPGLEEQILAGTGLQVISHDIAFKGICHHCQKQN